MGLFFHPKFTAFNNVDLREAMNKLCILKNKTRSTTPPHNQELEEVVEETDVVAEVAEETVEFPNIFIDDEALQLQDLEENNSDSQAEYLDDNNSVADPDFWNSMDDFDGVENDDDNISLLSFHESNIEINIHGQDNDERLIATGHPREIARSHLYTIYRILYYENVNHVHTVQQSVYGEIEYKGVSEIIDNIRQHFFPFLSNEEKNHLRV